MSARWYLVYCKPRQETTARRNLERQGYETYVPMLRQSRRKKGRMGSVTAPMFPRYLFIHLNEETDNWGPIRSTLGVVSIVRFGATAAAVPNDLIQLFRKREDAEGLQPTVVTPYRQGEKVRIAEGGFAGYEGIFFARSGKDRVTVLLQVLGRNTRAHVDLNTIERVG
jgi:transcriptional antiterminator RfaH